MRFGHFKLYLDPFGKLMGRLGPETRLVYRHSSYGNGQSTNLMNASPVLSGPVSRLPPSRDPVLFLGF